MINCLIPTNGSMLFEESLRLRGLVESVFVLANAMEEIADLILKYWTEEQWKNNMLQKRFSELYELACHSPLTTRIGAWAGLRYSASAVSDFEKRIDQWDSSLWRTRTNLSSPPTAPYVLQMADGTIRYKWSNEFWEDGIDRWLLSIQLGETLRSWARDLCKEAEFPVPEPDGPFGINKWRFNGNALEGQMQQKDWQLAQYLWLRINRKILIKDLIGKDNLFENVQEETISKHGSNITKWFTLRSAPLAVASRDRHIWMEKLD